MGYTDVFGGELIFPSKLSYLSITTAVDVTLQWPTEQQITGDSVVADFIDVDASVASLNIDMPSALVTGTVNKATFNNVGAETFTVRDSTGGTIQSVAPGEAWVIVLRDNTTAAGLWRTFQMGASVSVASASALAGAGIKAIGMTLNQKIDSDDENATPFTVVDGDRAKCLIFTAGAGTCNLTDPGTLGNDWFFMLRNSSSGVLNIVPASGLIDGSSTLNLDPNGSTFIFTDGSDFFTIGLTVSSSIGFDFVSLAVPGSGDFILSGANLNRIAYRFTGALIGARNIVVPNTTQQYWWDNSTTGGFAFTVATSGQASPPAIDENETLILYCDGTDVINAVNSSALTLPLAVAQGGTGATTPSGARANLSVPPLARDLIAGAGLTGGGDLSVDRTFDVGAGTGITVNADDVAVDAASPLNVDHSAVNLLAGDGIDATGLGDITVDRTINVDMLGLEDLAAPAADRIFFFDFSSSFSDFLVVGDGLAITLLQLDVDMLGLQDLVDPLADRIYFFDNSGSAAGFLTAGDGLTITLTDLDVDMLGLEDLAAPGADRIYFFDQSVGPAAGFLTLGSGLAITGTELDTTGAGLGNVFAGYVPANGIGEIVPSGWSVARASLGTYDVTHNLGLGGFEDLAVVVTAVNGVFVANTGFPVLGQIDDTNSDGNGFRVILTTDFAAVDERDEDWFFLASVTS